MRGLSFARSVIFGIAAIFALVVIGVDAHFISVSHQGVDDIFPIKGFGIGTGILTCIALLSLFFSPKTSFTSRLLAEVILLSIVWVLWFAIAAISTQTRLSNFPDGCYRANSDLGRTICNEASDIEGIAYVNGIWLMSYTNTLLAFVISGRRSWSDPVIYVPIGPTPESTPSTWKDAF